MLTLEFDRGTFVIEGADAAAMPFSRNDARTGDVRIAAYRFADLAAYLDAGGRCEALEACAAAARLGLTATAPRPDSDGATRLADVIGSVVYEVSMRELVGRHLAELSIVRVPVRLDEGEREKYDRLIEPLRF